MCKHYGKDDWEDLRSEIMIILFDTNKEVILKAIEGCYLHQYASRIARNQTGRRSYSVFHKNYNSCANESPEEIKSDQAYEHYDEHNDIEQDYYLKTVLSHAINPIEQVHHFAYLMLEISNGKSLRKLAKEIGCNHVYLFKGIQNYKNTCLKLQS